ncbi:nitroreductase/quinone reductase family protein [Marisediminicola antarctica]|uniref:Nitroreductase n=1 Tax=Marisediminicola antarctica TaxID=674079 RepID=A0A7L5AE24_9MICO|nr:nitroreductase/quinone reductase family protein [Marisediminicola antarctica]QHO68480.1 nitroreductase [Marisediminicola antarctica]
MPKDSTLRAMNTVHRMLLKLSGGRVGWHAMGMPVIELTTTGRKSGQPRTAMLTAPLVEGDTYVIVASRGGDDTHPAWFLNLRDEPRVSVVIKGGAPETRLARVASTDERARMWPLITSRYRNYAGYQQRTEREIPLVLLEPLP